MQSNQSILSIVKFVHVCLSIYAYVRLFCQFCTISSVLSIWSVFSLFVSIMSIFIGFVDYVNFHRFCRFSRCGQCFTICVNYFYFHLFRRFLAHQFGQSLPNALILSTTSVSRYFIKLSITSPFNVFVDFVYLLLSCPLLRLKYTFTCKSRCSDNIVRTVNQFRFFVIFFNIQILFQNILGRNVQLSIKIHIIDIDQKRIHFLW